MNFHALFSPLPHSGSCTWTRWCSTDCSVTQRDQRPVQSSCIIHRMQSEYVNCGLQSKVSAHLWSARLCWMRLPNCNARQNSTLPFWKWTNKKCRVFVDSKGACDWLVDREEVCDSLEPFIPDFSSISPSSTWRWRRHRPWFCLLWSTYFYVLTPLPPSPPRPPPIEQINQSVEGQNKSENSLNRMICSACETLGYSIIFGPTCILYLIDGAELSLVFWVFLRHWKFSCIRKLNLQSGRNQGINNFHFTTTCDFPLQDQGVATLLQIYLDVCCFLCFLCVKPNTRLVLDNTPDKNNWQVRAASPTEIFRSENDVIPSSDIHIQ